MTISQMFHSTSIFKKIAYNVNLKNEVWGMHAYALQLSGKFIT